MDRSPFACSGVHAIQDKGRNVHEESLSPSQDVASRVLRNHMKESETVGFLKTSRFLTAPAQFVDMLDALSAPAILALNASGTEICTNRAFREFVAMPSAMTTPLSVRFLENGKLLSMDEEPQARALTGTPVNAMRLDIERSDGILCSVIVTAVPLRDDEGSVVGALTLLQAAEIQPPSHAQDIANHAPALLFITDADGAFRSVNARWNAFIGAQADQLLGFGWKNFVHPQDLSRVCEEWSLHLSDGEKFVSQWRFLRSGMYQ